MNVRRGPDRMTVVILLVAAGVAAACVAIVVLSDRANKRPSNPTIVNPPQWAKEKPAEEKRAELRYTVPEKIAVLGPPIPQDEARQAARRRRVRERYERQILNAYESAGRRDPRWDAAARTALRGLVEALCGRSTTIYVHHERTALDSARKAVAAGCTDPFIRYLTLRFVFDYEQAIEQRNGDPQVTGVYQALLPDMRASRYPPAVKAHVFVNAATALTYGPQSGTRAEVKGLLDECLEQTAALLDEKSDLAREEAFELCVQVANVGRWLADDRRVWYEQAAAALGDRPGADLVRHLLTGERSIHSAWDARGSGVAATVTEEGWRLFGEWLQEAEQAFEAAWAADQNCVTAPLKMLTVCKGLSHDRDTMERWFRRAMEIDGDSLEACDYKLDYLLPKWHGGVEEAVSFARQCRDTGNWHGSLPLALSHAHRWLASDSGSKQEYFAQPAVRADVESVYRPLLKRFPDAQCARTNFFLLAVEGHWADIAREHLPAMIDDPWKPAFRNGPDHGACIHWAETH